MTTEQFAIPERPPRAGEDAAHLVLANGLRHHVLEYGTGAPIVVLPGMTAAAATFAFLAKALAGDHQVLVLDVRGRGLSDQPPAGFSLDDYAADLLGVLDELALVAPILLGHSMGARIAAAFDVASPGRAAGLVLIDPPLSGPGREPYPNPLSMYRSMFEIARSADDPIRALREIEPDAGDEELADRIRWLRVTDEHAIVETYKGFHEEDYHALHERITAPSVLVRGEHSQVVTPAGAAELRRLRPDIPIVDVRGAGHLVPQQNLSATCDVVETFASSDDVRQRATQIEAEKEE